METRRKELNTEDRLRRERRIAMRRAREQEQRANRWRTLAYGFLVLCALILAVAATLDVRAAAEEPEAPAAAETVPAAEAEGEDPMEAEKIEDALLESGYLSNEIPMEYDLQAILRAACDQYDVPYALALGVIQVESGFDRDALGRVGEVGMMQLNPGPGGAYHASLEAETGFDPTTPGGNLVCGTYLLGCALGKHNGDKTEALMAYNMGEAGAAKARKNGVTSTMYTAAVLAAAEEWEDII